MISRREFLDRASGIAVAGLSGAALLDALNPKFAEAQQVAPTDARLKTESVEIAAPGTARRVVTWCSRQRPRESCPS